MLEVGSVVLSTAGRDKGNLFIVIELDNNFVYLVDGDIHKIENPKCKKIKHVEATSHDVKFLKEKLISKHKLTNQDFKRVLNKLQAK